MIARVMRTELRRGLPQWSFPVALLAAALPVVNVILYQPAWGLAWPIVPAAVLHMMVPLLGGLTLAVAAWQGGRERRRGTVDLLGSVSRPQLQRAFVAWLPAAAWTVLGYALGVAVDVVSVFLVVGVPVGPLLPGLFVAGGITLVAYSALGFALGWYIPGRFTAPIAGGATCGVTILWLAPYGRPGLFVTHNGLVGGSTAWHGPVWWYAPAAGIWFGGLAIAFLVLTSSRSRWLAVVPLAVAVIAAVPITRTQVWRIDRSSPLLACGGEPVPVCVSHTAEGKLPEVKRSTRTLRKRIATVPSTAGLWQVRPAYVWPEMPCVPETSNSPCQRGKDPGSAGAYLAKHISTVGSCIVSDWDDIYAAGVDNRLAKGVQGWLLGEPRGARGITERIAAMPEHQRDAWLVRYFRATTDCDVPALNALHADLAGGARS